MVPEEFGGAGASWPTLQPFFEELPHLVKTPASTTLVELARSPPTSRDTDTVEQLAAGEATRGVPIATTSSTGDIADVVIVVEDARRLRWKELPPGGDTPSTRDPPTGAATPGATEAIGTDPGIAGYRRHSAGGPNRSAASRCLEPTVDYTRKRVQFGRPIGSFQALKHRMADLYVAVQSARAVVGDAIAEPTASSAVLARLPPAFTTVAGEAIHGNGGIAITWEHDIQLYFKRAHGSATFGPPREQLVQAGNPRCSGRLLNNPARRWGLSGILG